MTYRRDDASEINKALSYLHDQGVIELEAGVNSAGARLEIKGRGRSQLHHYAGLVENYLESYWVVIRGTAYLRKEARSERSWMKSLIKLGTRMYRKGEIRRAEALSQANYQNAIAFLKDYGIVLVSEAPDKKDRREAVSTPSGKTGRPWRSCAGGYSGICRCGRAGKNRMEKWAGTVQAGCAVPPSISKTF